MRNQELLPLFATAIAIELVHLRWIMLTKWTCRGCHASHMKCACKYGWLKRLLSHVRGQSPDMSLRDS